MSTRPSRVFVAGLAVALVASLAALTSAQDRRGGGRGGFERLGNWGARSGMALLVIEAVQKDLKLTDEQVTAVTDLNASLRESRREYFQGWRDLSPEERAKKQAARNEETNKKIVEILKPEQDERLTQIEIQEYGPSVLAYAKYAKMLKATEAQQEKIAKLQDDARAPLRELFQSLRDSGGDREAVGEKMAAAVAKAHAKLNKDILAVLTADQREAFDKMKGKTLDLPQWQFGTRRQRDN